MCIVTIIIFIPQVLISVQKKKTFKKIIFPLKPNYKITVMQMRLFNLLYNGPELCLNIQKMTKCKKWG